MTHDEGLPGVNPGKDNWDGTRQDNMDVSQDTFEPYQNQTRLAIFPI